MGSNTVLITAEKINKRKKKIKFIKASILCLILFLFLIYFVLNIIYKGANFTISIDPNFTNDKGIILYDDIEVKKSTRKLYVENMGFMDNISIKWLPKDISSSTGGSHNGDNYIAYTFYIENQGEKDINYWYEIHIDDVIKNVDEAIRIIVYRNENQTVYAKLNSDSKKAEPDTVAFYSEKIAVLESRTGFKPGDIDKFTVVFFLEGDDPDCVDALIGGEIKMKMDIYEENADVKRDK